MVGVERTLQEERRSLEAIMDRMRGEAAAQQTLAAEAATRMRAEVNDLYARYNASEAALARQAIEMSKAADEVIYYCTLNEMNYEGN